MEVTINGNLTQVTSCNLSELITELGLGDKKIAIEHNKEVVPRAMHLDVKLSEGDIVEIISFVGGG